MGKNFWACVYGSFWHAYPRVQFYSIWCWYDSFSMGMLCMFVHVCVILGLWFRSVLNEYIYVCTRVQSFANGCVYMEIIKCLIVQLFGLGVST